MERTHGNLLHERRDPFLKFSGDSDGNLNSFLSLTDHRRFVIEMDSKVEGRLQEPILLLCGRAAFVFPAPNISTPTPTPIAFRRRSAYRTHIPYSEQRCRQFLKIQSFHKMNIKL